MPVDNNNAENLDVNDVTSQQNQETGTEDWDNDEANDPMLAGLTEAEEQLRDDVKAKQTNGDADSEEDAELDSEDGSTTDKPQGSTTADEKSSKMVPIERLNQVIDKAKALEDQVNYQKGIIDVQSKALSTKAPAVSDAQADKPEGEAKGNDLESQISTAEDKKLELAQKYEDGEIGFAEMQKATVALDREIREHQLKRVNEIEQNSRTVAAETVRQNNIEQTINQEALTLQQKHPYINAIDLLPEHLKNGVWNQITSDAVASLLAQGINPNDGRPETKIALVREKAALTDKYGPQYAQLLIKNQQTEQQSAISEKAQSRADKLDLASKQPPQMPKGFGTYDREVTKDQIEKMDEDQLADMLTKNPELLEKATGIKSK